ncbi:hypothetical protein KM043_014457 [Ampulex compressa]|nr:hypothetical protein KM043_014457 [Ampulex compressa]
MTAIFTHTVNMNDILKELEALKITENISEEDIWLACINVIQKSFVPQKLVGNDRPCDEKDFREYRLIIDRNLWNVKSMLQHIVNSSNEGKVDINYDIAVVKTFTINLLLLIGEHQVKTIWNTAESVFIAKELSASICKLYGYQNISQFLMGQDKFLLVLLMLRPKLLKDTWKTYPAAIACYKWVLQEVEKPALYNHICEVLPTTLLMVDDYMPENVILGLECIYHIIQHSYMKKGLIDTGYAMVIYHVFERLTHQREARYVVLVYSCMASLLVTMEHWDSTLNVFEWTSRDDVLAILLDNMEFEQNVELRYVYMLSLPQLLTNMGCAKWCERLTRVLSEYCEHHTDLRTLKATLEKLTWM